MSDEIFERFVEETPISVMVRGIMERIFEPKALDELFELHVKSQYTRELLFSSVVGLMSLVLKDPTDDMRSGIFRTKFIRLTTLENNNSLVYCLTA
jgi:hypothetical protein